MKNNKIARCFNAVKNDSVLELVLYDVIGATMDGEGVTAKDVKAALDGEYDSILLRINSPGGSAFEGVAIHNLLKSTGKPINVVVDGLAASAASIVAMAGDQINMNSNAVMMIHKAWSMCIGNSTDLRRDADMLETVDKAIAQTFVDRTGQPMDMISTMMTAETWMTAQDALKNGFCSAIGNSDNKAAMNFAKTFSHSLANMKNLPAVLKNESNDECPCDCSNCEADECENCTNVNCTSENCEDCPQQKGVQDKVATPETSNLSLFKAKAWLAAHQS